MAGKRNDQKLTPKKPPGPHGDWKPVFLVALAGSANVRSACIAAGISRPWAYGQKKADPEFASAWQTALDDALDILESVAFRRAAETSDTLLIFLLKSHRRSVYGDKVEVNARTVLEVVEEIVDCPTPDGTPAPDAG